MIFCMVIFSLSTCSRPSQYGIRVNAISEKGYGVIITGFPIMKSHHNFNNSGYIYQKEPFIIRAYPKNPSEYSGTIQLPPFDKHGGRRLPDEITFTYQLAKISDCGSSWKNQKWDIKTRKPIEGSAVYHTKNDCKKWEPLEDKKFTKTINLKKMIESEEMKRLGKSKKTSSFSYYLSTIIFDFYDDGAVKMRAKNSSTNAWK